VDNFQIERFVCGEPCDGDTNGDGAVGQADLLAVLSGWGQCAGCAGDVDDNGVVGFFDLLIVMGAWGPCP
jgi:hypothetical protein